MLAQRIGAFFHRLRFKEVGSSWVNGTLRCPGYVCFSNRPFGVKHFQTIHHCSVDVARGSRFSPESARKGRSNMGSEDEVEQSQSRPCVRRTAGQTGSRTHLIHRPARDITFHRRVELECPPTISDLARLSCCCRDLFPGPAELGAVNPHAMHRQRPAGALAPRSPFSSRNVWRSASPRP